MVGKVPHVSKLAFLSANPETLRNKRTAQFDIDLVIILIGFKRGVSHEPCVYLHRSDREFVCYHEQEDYHDVVMTFGRAK